VQVIRIDRSPDPKRSEQVALSLKALESDPWETATQTLVEGSRVQGTVTRVAAFGAFVELMPGIEGLVHISELGGGQSQRQVRVTVKPGDPLEVTILGVDRERRRVSLSTALPDEPLDADARGAIARAAGPLGAASKPGKLGTLGDLLKSASERAKR